MKERIDSHDDWKQSLPQHGGTLLFMLVSKRIELHKEGLCSKWHKTNAWKVRDGL